jgi:putative oxidoreductase
MFPTTLHPAWGLTVVRLVMGVILIVAGYTKLAAGVGGFQGFVANMGIPMPEFFGAFIPILELIGGILVLFGLAARWVAILFAIEFLVVLVVVKLPRPAPFGGFDSARIDFMMLAAAVMLLLVGPGKLALDDWLLGRRGAGSSST